MGKSGRKRILLVDDEPDLNFMFKKGLERHGFEVEVFDDPADALKNYKKKYYDLLLLDVKMKDMSGVDLLKEIQGKDQDIGKVCFLTASNISYEEITQSLPIYSDLEDGNSGKEGKSEETRFHILQKPISIKQLSGILHSIIPS